MYGYYKTTLLAALFAAVSVLLATAITAEPRSTPKSGPNNSIVLPANSKGILSQCGDYYTFSPAMANYGVIPDSYDQDFIPVPPKITVPAYGYMAASEFHADEAATLKQGDNPYNIADVNRGLWEGHSFIWLDDELAAETYTYVQDYANKWNQSHANKVIALTWTGSIALTTDGKKKALPSDRDFAFSSWNVSQTCMSFSEAAFEEFFKQAEQHNAGRNSSHLPMAVLGADGSLPNHND